MSLRVITPEKVELLFVAGTVEPSVKVPPLPETTVIGFGMFRLTSMETRVAEPPPVLPRNMGFVAGPNGLLETKTTAPLAMVELPVKVLSLPAWRKISPASGLLLTLL